MLYGTFFKKALFSKPEKCYCFSMFINHTCKPPSDVFNFVFQKLFVLNFNKKIDAVPLWDFCTSDLKVAILKLKSLIIYRNDNVARLMKVN